MWLLTWPSNVVQHLEYLRKDILVNLKGTRLYAVIRIAGQSEMFADW